MTKSLAVCIEPALLVMFSSAWPLWWFVLKVGIILVAILGAAEFALRVVYHRKDRRNKEEPSEMTVIAEASIRLNAACSDAQGQLRKSNIPQDQADRMAQAILRDHSTSRTPLRLGIGKPKSWALTRFIHEILNRNGE
jgi:hypothetical protein